MNLANMLLSLLNRVDKILVVDNQQFVVFSGNILNKLLLG